MSGSGYVSWTWGNQNLQISFNWSSSTKPSQTSCNAAITSWWNAYSGTFGATAQRTACGPTNHSYTLDNGDTVNVRESMTYYNSTCNTVRYAASAPSGNATINVGGKWCFMYRSGMQALYPGIAGQASTMFGNTAAGAAVGGSAGTVNQTVSVTPGTGYSYTRGYVIRHNPWGSSTGSIVLTYYQ